MKILAHLSQFTVYKRFLFLANESSETESGAIDAAKKSAEKISETEYDTEKYLTGLDTGVQLKKMSRLDLTKNVDGIGTQRARRLAMESQFKNAKSTLEQRQSDLEKLYLGTKGAKAFFEVYEKHMGRTIDSRTGLVGGIGKILSVFKLSFNPSLEKKICKKCGIQPERFREIYKSTYRELQKNQDNFNEIEAAEAREANMDIKAFRKSGEYKTFMSDLLSVGVSLGLNALGLGAGVAVPLIYINPKRRAFAADANSALKYMRDGLSYTDAMAAAAKNTERATLTSYNLAANADLLVAGPNAVDYDRLDERWRNYGALKKHLQFDAAQYFEKDPEAKNFAQALGMTIDKQGAVHFKEAKKLRTVLFRFGERMWVFGSDKKENKRYKQAVRVLKKNPRKNATAADVIRANQDKVFALETITEMIKSENAEDFLRKRYRKHSEKKEGREAALMQMERFLSSQRDLVTQQTNLHRLNIIDSKKAGAEKSAEILYKNALVSMLSGFKTSSEVLAHFPVQEQIVRDENGECIIPESERARRRKIEGFLSQYYGGKNERGEFHEWNNELLDAMIADPDFQDWVHDIGAWTQMQRTSNTSCKYYSMSALQRTRFNEAAINNQTNKNSAEYSYDSAAAIAPHGQGAGLPLVASSAWFDPNWLNIGDPYNSLDGIFKNSSSAASGPAGPVMGLPTALVDQVERRTLEQQLASTFGPMAAAMIGRGIFKGKTRSVKELRRDERVRAQQ